MIIALKLFAVLLILVAMTAVLVGINRLFVHTDPELDDLHEFRSDVRNGYEVVGRQNSFRDFFGTSRNR
ncbi:MAG: hypothetical protein HDS79_04475 [Bacteroidales bacterium]|nr:hypothetical protein [Bacteroidales bacterium]MDE7466003.1 hypothetical protein [Muribaculaceae bacterium]